MLIPKDEDAKTMVEVRAGTGGDEASIFCRRFVPYVH
jgi:protein subunit release factor A